MHYLTGFFLAAYLPLSIYSQITHGARKHRLDFHTKPPLINFYIFVVMEKQCETSFTFKGEMPKWYVRKLSITYSEGMIYICNSFFFFNDFYE